MQKNALTRLTSLYLCLMLTVFLLWPGTSGYAQIAEAKYRLFLWLTGGYCALSVLLWLGAGPHSKDGVLRAAQPCGVAAAGVSALFADRLSALAVAGGNMARRRAARGAAHDCALCAELLSGAALCASGGMDAGCARRGGHAVLCRRCFAAPWEEPIRPLSRRADLLRRGQGVFRRIPRHRGQRGLCRRDPLHGDPRAAVRRMAAAALAFARFRRRWGWRSRCG